MTSTIPEAPLVVRGGLADLLGRLGVVAFRMEDHGRGAGEPNMALFRRFVRQEEVEAFLV